jgi:polysaccharide pyruvyl transferase WcaK-like protein
MVNSVKMSETWSGDQQIPGGAITPGLARNPMACQFRDQAAPQAKTLPKSIALFGLFGGGNFGNDASLFAMLRYLREAFPNATISSICANPAKVTKDSGIPAVSIYPVRAKRERRSNNRLVRLLYRLFVRLPAEVAIWLKTFAYLRTVDALIIPGTGVLDDFGLVSSYFPYNLFKWCLLAKLSGAKVLFVSIGAGPIAKGVSRWLMTAAARVADYRSYRDKISKDFMTGIGFDTHNDGVCPDLVFSLPMSATGGYPEGRAEPLTIGVGVMTYGGWKNDGDSAQEVYRTYIGKLAAFVQWLLDQRCYVRLLVGQATDQRAVDDLLASISANSVDPGKPQIVSEPIHSIEDLMREVAATDIVVATRFHNVVCALMLNKPVVSIGYAKKNDVLMGEIGLAKFCQQVERLNVDLLIEQFRELAVDCQRFHQTIREKNLQYREDLRLQFSNILSQLSHDECTAQQRV